MNSLIFNLETKKEDTGESNSHINGMIVGAKLMMSLVHAWQMEVPDLCGDDDNEHHPYPVKITSEGN
jgi:hypothetical protein